MPRVTRLQMGTAMPCRRRFTLIELLVVVAIISVLAAMLLPALNQAKKQAKHSVCISQMKQHGVAHGSYASDNEGYFPDFGGLVAERSASRYMSLQLRLFKFGNDGGGLTYATDYLAVTAAKPQHVAGKIMYCPAIDWRAEGYPGYYIMDNPASLRFENAIPSGSVGYFFYAGRKMFRSTHSNADTTIRRFDPAELLMTDSIGGSDRNETGANYIRKNAWNWAAAWTLNPHEGVDTKFHHAHTSNAHQLSADGATHTFQARLAKRTVAWGTVNGAYATITGPKNSMTDGRYYRVIGY